MGESFKTRTNTEFERIAIAGGVNLSDGHARLPLDPVQLKLIESIPAQFERLASAAQTEVEARFLEKYFLTMGQSTALRQPLFLSYSVSFGIQIAAQILGRMCGVVGLIEPVFDNIRHYLEWERLDLQPVGEQVLVGDDDAVMRLPRGSALWLVSPNNPTGMVVGRDRFERILSICRARDLTIVVDASFRPHSSTARSWDMYESLLESGVDFLVIEDTGKTWSLLDLKVGIMACSSGLRSVVHRLHDQLLLNVSPVVLAVVSEFVDDFRIRGYEETIGESLDANRESVHELIDRAGFSHAGECGNVPLELLALPECIEPEAYWRACKSAGVHVLPAHNYYWSGGPDRALFRVPLARPCAELKWACDVMAEVALKVASP
ncbi:MAG: pyridoxal phosphate-dependent aminotransferase [Microthrixaceae bacterium]